MNVQVFVLGLTSPPFSNDPVGAQKCETKGQMISLAKVMACYNRSKDQIEQPEGAVGFPDRERAKGKVGLDLKPGQRKTNRRSKVPLLGRRGPDVEQRDWCKCRFHIHVRNKKTCYWHGSTAIRWSLHSKFHP